MAASVRARLTDRARERKADAQLLMIRFVIERLLWRLSISPYQGLFVLKGAMLFSLWTSTPYRATGDLDLPHRDADLRMNEARDMQFAGSGKRSRRHLGAVGRQMVGHSRTPFHILNEGSGGLAPNCPSLRRHDPDQVRRVTVLLTESQPCGKGSPWMRKLCASLRGKVKSASAGMAKWAAAAIRRDRLTAINFAS
jgi:hypothetical protein